MSESPLILPLLSASKIHHVLNFKKHL